MSVRVELGGVQRLRGGRHRADAHGRRRHAADAPGDQPGQRPQPELGGPVAGWVTTQTAAPSFCPLALPGGDGGVGVVAAEDRAQRRPASPRVESGADVLVAVDDGLAPAARHRDRHDLVGEPALLARPRRRAGGVRTANSSCSSRGMRVLAAQVLRGLEHPAGHREVDAAGGDPAAGQRVVQQHAGAGLDAPPHRGGVERRVAHRLRAAGQHDAPTPRSAPACAAYSTACRPEPQRRSICRPVSGDRQAGVQRGDPADRRGVHRRVAVAEQRRRRPPPAAGRCAPAGRGSRWRPARAAGTSRSDAAEPADRGAQRLADHRVAHRNRR